MNLALPLAFGVMYTLYNLKKKNSRKEQKIRDSVSKNEKFSGKDSYESSRYHDVKQAIQEQANKAFEESRDFKNTNRIPPFVNSLCHQSDCSGTDKTKKIKSQIIPKITPGEKKKPISFSDTITESLQKGREGEIDIKQPKSLLTGEPLDMQHNNMVPFFSGQQKQDTRINSTAGIIERFTGKMDTPTTKKAIPSLFDKEKENIYGTPLFTSQVKRDRFYQSGLKNNIGPVPQVKVKPLPEESVRPVFKSLEELRSGSNVKSRTFDGRTVDGQNPSTLQRPVVESFSKNKQSTVYNNNPSRYFTGSYINRERAPEDYSNLQDTNRQNEQIHDGPAGSYVPKQNISIQREGKESREFLMTSSLPFKNNYKSDSIRNLGAEGQNVTDYGKCSFIAPITERQSTSRQHVLNIKDTNLGGHLLLPDEAKTTQKELVLYNYIGNAESQVPNQVNRGEYFNYKTSDKENTLYQNDYMPGPQKQTDTAGSQSITLTHNKNTDALKDYIGNPDTIYDKFNNDIGLTSQDNNRMITEHDFSNRISSEFIDQLNSNPLSIKRENF